MAEPRHHEPAREPKFANPSPQFRAEHALAEQHDTRDRIFAQNETGSGPSKCYVAQDADMEVSVLPAEFDNSIRFVYVMPWRWVSKKGIAFAERKCTYVTVRQTSNAESKQSKDAKPGISRT